MGITAQDDSIDPGVGVVGSNELLSVLHPPHQPGSGKPAYVKRGPGRPRKDNTVGLGKVHKLGLSQKTKTLYGGMPGPSLNRGLQGRKKPDGLLSAGGTNLAVSYIGELSAISHESPQGGGDDAAESDTSSVASSLEKLHEDFSLLPEQWPGKVCAFCNLGERSMLGQGELIRLEIPENFDPVAVSSGLSVKGKLDKDVNNEKGQKPGFSCRRQKGTVNKMKRLTSQSSLESMNEPVDEVCGHPEEPEYSSIFDIPSGYYYVHHGCANWCDGVTHKEDSSFSNLEVGVIRSLNQRCLHCGNLGAGVICKAPNCGAVFHFPCAAISGAFQDPCSKTVLCSSHLDLAVALVGDKANCTVCESPGKISSLLMCSSCGQHYHGSCMALNCDPGIRAGWQCPACKICQACRQPGDESKLLSCDTCDKSYHIFCLRPALSSIPKHSWKCKLCRMCTDCGARTPGSGPSSRWHANFSVCDSCYQQRNKGLACPMCGKAYRHVAQKLMLQCHLCKKYVHGTCDPAADLATYQQRKDIQPGYEYICIPCKNQQSGQGPSAGVPRIISSSKRVSDELGSDENSMLNNNNSSQDSLFSPEDDSVQSIENSSDVLWPEKSLPTLPDDKHAHLPNYHQQPPKDNKLLNYEAKLHKRKSLGASSRVKSLERLGHYSTNNNRRSKVTEFAKKRGPKPKLRMFSSGRCHRASTDSFPKEEEVSVGVENRMILCSARDDFVLQQDVCVMCGAYGNDLEGRLIACAQCGQCYHPYCVNVKVNKVILNKGWRCLDCTVCEGCGQRHDEARLILCDECDVSFHIYCMDPPLDSVPHGTWKCKWCVVCQYCGSNDPGKNSIWHNNYTTCGPCASFSSCPVCKLEYTDGELIIKCSKCDRWIHANCDSIKNDDDAEKCSDENYNCVLCRPSDVLPPHLRPPPPPIVTKVELPPKSPDLLRSTSQFTVDGTCLSDAGMSHIKSLTMDFPRKKRKRMPNIADMEAGILAAIESVVSGGDDRIKDAKEGPDDGNEKDKEAKKRQRNLQKLGIGGFVVRLRGPRFKDEDDLSLDQLASESGDKPKRKAKRRNIPKNKLVENFPVYLQEAFFGKTLLEPNTKETDLVSTTDELEETTPSIKNENIIKLSKEEIKEIEAIKAKQKSPEKVKAGNRQAADQPSQHVTADMTKEIRKLQPPIVDDDDGEMALRDILGDDLLDNDFMDNIMSEGDDIKVEGGLVDFRSGAEDSNDFPLDQNAEDVNQKDEFNDIITSQFGLENIDPGLPSMDSKDVEDIFKGVLIEETPDTLFSQVSNVPPVTEVGPSSRVNSNPPMLPSSIGVSSPTSVLPPNITTPVQASPGLPRATPLQQNLTSPVQSFPPPSPYPSEYSNSPQFSPAFSEPPSPWPAQADTESDQPSSYNQRNMLKWEADEALGPNATISCVLYANLNHPELKRDYTTWNERAKQISKIWRSLSTEKKAPYLQKARENRAASRMQKAQQMPKENRGDGPPSSSSSSIKADGSLTSHSPSESCEAHLKGSHGGAGASASIIGPATVIKTEMDIDSCGPSPCSHSDIMRHTESPCYHSPPSSSYSSSSIEVVAPSCAQSYSRLACSQSPTSSNSIPLPPSPHLHHPHHHHHPHHLHLPPKNSLMPFGDKEGPGLPLHHKYCFAGDHHPHIRGLPSPADLTRSLPAGLGQESCNFAGIMDQEKLAAGQSKNARVETQEERQWKQMQQMRQQQQHPQQPGLPPGDQHKDGGILAGNTTPLPGASPMPFSPGSGNMGVGQRLMLPGSPVSGGIDCVRQPLQSPHSPAPMARPPFPQSLPMGRPRPPNMTIAMPPPSPSGVYPSRPETPTGGQNIRGPMYARLPFTHQTRQAVPLQSDVYGNPPTPQQQNDQVPQSPLPPPRPYEPDNMSPSEPYGQKVLQDQFSHSPVPQQQQGSEQDINNVQRGSQSPQTPGAKQHLRGLLQQQQIKRLEQEQIPQSPSDPNRPPVSWSHDDPTKLQGVDSQLAQRLGVPNAPPQVRGVSVGEFRQPLLPSHVRVSANVAQLSPHVGKGPMGDFRLGGPGVPGPVHSMDPRARILMQHQQRGILVQSQRAIRPSSFNSQYAAIRNASLDPYDHLVVQQQQQQQRMAGPSASVSTSSMLAQQLGRPLNSAPQKPTHPVSSPQLSPHHIHSPHQPSPMISGVSNTDSASTMSPAAIAGDHQELPDSVTEELEKLEQEHSDHVVEGEASELADLGMDDDELLGMGDDFNILEYADSELDDVVGGGKTNILDNLDLEEDEKEEKELQRKDESEKEEKKEGIAGDFPGHPKTSNMTKVTDALTSQPNVSIMSPTSSGNFIHTGGPGDAQILRPSGPPAPPPPPYPGPPPPYPGRPQMGIRNGCGVIPNMPSVSALSGAPRNSLGTVGGIRPPLASPSMPPNANPHLHLTTQRRTLLLQEQPLLLEDLLEQEKREQQKQTPAPGLMGAAPEEPLLSDFDFERLKADVLSSSNLPVSLSPPNIVGQNVAMPNQPGLFVRNPSALGQVHPPQQGTPPTWQMDGGQNPNNPHVNQQQNSLDSSNPMHQNLQPAPGVGPPGGNNTPGGGPRIHLAPVPPPPNPPEHPTTEQERQQQVQYEQWLFHQQNVLAMQLKCVETEVNKLRKQKKAINCKIRQLKKTGAQLNETDSMELERIGRELPGLQKQLDQARKQSRQHGLLTQDYRNKQQKKQQMMGMNPGSQGPTPQNSLPTQMSPLGASSPLHSTPQSPMLCSSPSMSGPSPSPLMQHSPMASPLTPSPGPHSASLSQTSPRVVVNPGQHQMDDQMPFSPSNDPNMRPIPAQLPQNRHPSGKPQQVQMRMGNPNVTSHQIIVSQSGNANQPSQGIMIVRGINPNMIPMHQQRAVGFVDGQGMSRVRAVGSQEQMKILASMSPRFQRVGISQEVLARVKGPQSFPNPPQMPMSPGGQHYSNARVPFPTQSPNSTNMNMNMGGSMRSPSPMTPVGGLGSPTSNQVMMVQNRVSPASSPMRRPSGSGSIGAPSPMTDRPQSVENPLTPRSTAGSRPHTPIGSNVMQQHTMDGMGGQHGSGMDNTQFTLDGTDSSNVHIVQTFSGKPHAYSCAPTTPSHPEYGVTSVAGGGGGGGQNHQILPFPTFSWSDEARKMGLKGGNPFSVINESVPTTNNTNPTPETVTQTTITVTNFQPNENAVTEPRLPGCAADGENSSVSGGSSTLDNSVSQESVVVLPMKSEVCNNLPVATTSNATEPVPAQPVSTSPTVKMTNCTPTNSNASSSKQDEVPTSPVIISTPVTTTSSVEIVVKEEPQPLQNSLPPPPLPVLTSSNSVQDSTTIPNTTSAPSQSPVATNSNCVQELTSSTANTSTTAPTVTTISNHVADANNAVVTKTSPPAFNSFPMTSSGATVSNSSGPPPPVPVTKTAVVPPSSLKPPPTVTLPIVSTLTATPVISSPAPATQTSTQSVVLASVTASSTPLPSTLPIQHLASSSVPSSIAIGNTLASISVSPPSSTVTSVTFVPPPATLPSSTLPTSSANFMTLPVSRNSAPPPPSTSVGPNVSSVVGVSASGLASMPTASSPLLPSVIPQQQTAATVALSSMPISTFSTASTPTVPPPPMPSMQPASSTTLIYTSNTLNAPIHISAPTRMSLPVSLPHQFQNKINATVHPSTGIVSLSSPSAVQTVHTFPVQVANQVSSTPIYVSDSSQLSMVTAVSNMIPTVISTSIPTSGGGIVTSQSQGESQNALLKQLLQNTGCASMTQSTAENVGFSLTSCLQTRPAPGIASHLSENATRIPHPTPVVRPPTPATPTSIPGTPPLIRPPLIKTEPMMIEEYVQVTTPSMPHCSTPPIINEAADVKPQVSDIVLSNLDPSKEAIIAVVREATENMLQNSEKSSNNEVSSPTGSVTPTTSTAEPGCSKKTEAEDAKKLKRRQYQQKRKQSANKGDSPVSKKRPRKVGRAEDEFEGFLETFMTQLRQLSPIGIVEPELSHNYNVCNVHGSGDFGKLMQKNYSTIQGDLVGSFGRGTLPSKSDFYNTRPFGNETPKPAPKPQSTHRGFYCQEFATPKLGTFAEKIRSDNRTPTPVRETDTPDTIVSASSPECTSWDNITLYPGLKYIDDDFDRDLERCISPEIPLLVPIPIRPVLVDKSKELTKDIKDMDKENKNGMKDGVNGTKLRGFTPLKEAGNITVTLTLSSAAADDIRGLLRNLANVLSIAAPTYQVIDKGGAIIPDQKSHLYTIKGKDGKEKIDIQSILNGAAKFCRHCDVVVLSNVIKKKVSDFPGVQPTQLNGAGDPSEDFYFCSTTCLMQFSITHGVTIIEDKAAAVVSHPGDGENVKSELKLKETKLKNKLSDAHAESKLLKNKVKEEGVDDKGALKSDKKWKGSRYRNWGATFIPPIKYKKPTDKEVTEMLFRLGITAMPSKIPIDSRECIFCHLQGDCVSDGPGRLLNFDVDKWVHLNCALWSDDVYETENGALVNVELALKQSLTLACVVCKQKGATVKCFKTRCSQVYHLGCATKEGCIFYKNKTVYCPAHIPKGEKENELTTLSVYRRVYIQRDENKQVAAVMHHADQHHLLRVGSLIFLNVGQLLPHQLQAFHTPNFIYPIGYKIARFYWSMRKVNKRCQYICSIHDVDGKPEFRITTQEEGYKEHIVKGNSAQAAWLQILEAISKVRNAAEIIKVFPKYITGEDLFGLTEPSIVKVLESLPGIETLTDYHFKYGRNPLLELPLAINPTGCARSEPKLRTHFKRPHTQRTGPSRSTHLNTTSVISSEAACPYSKQFVHSKSSQYKKMKQEWRNNVYLARSKIQGLGLYAARDIEKHTMVIEYIGEIIRPELAESREKKYEASNRGIYMFRMDENRVIDATLCGGLARYINHSCNPNCVAETVEVDRDLRIIIFANRRISRGEELSYDYKFEFEDDQHKIPCLCGAPNCQQWMN